jgi:hypothetical protein
MHFIDLIEMRVVKEGVGSWSEVQTMPVDAVVDAFYYHVFLDTYSETHHIINSQESQ